MAKSKYLVAHKTTYEVKYSDISLPTARARLAKLGDEYMIVLQPEPNEAIDKKVLARRQKDADGFIEKHQAILDARAVKYAKEIEPTWTRIRQGITSEIRNIYKELEDANGVPITKQPIQADKYRNMQRQMIRLQKLESQLVDLIGTPAQKTKLDRNLAYTYTEAYYFHAFGMEQAAKVAINVPTLTTGHLIGTIINPWLPDGATYSDRLRANTAFLAKKMSRSLENAVGAGWSINRTAREIESNANEGYYNAVRLARTEMNRAAGQGASHVYMQNADIMDDKRWNATLDARTSPKDAQNDGERFPLDYDTPESPGTAGKRIPNHPNCRCKWSPVLSALGISARERIARGAGDDKKNFGERTYTKARNYDEYAKERGLPDVSESVRNDDPRKYLRRGETMADVPKNFFDPFTPVAAPPLVPKPTPTPTAKALPAVKAAKAPVVSGFVEAKTINEANTWAAKHLPRIKKVDYKGYDIKLANEVNQELLNLMTVYPEIEDINYVGTAQSRNKLLFEKQKEQFLKQNASVFANQPQSVIDRYVKKHVKLKTVAGNVQAQAANKTWGDLAGITFNVNTAKDYEAFKATSVRGVASRWAPEGTENPVSVLIHEFGHSIDYFLESKGLRNRYLTPITKAALADPNLANELSRYGTTNDREVIAEAFAEYRMNPNPRKWARLVGEAIENALEEYRRTRA